MIKKLLATLILIIFTTSLAASALAAKKKRLPYEDAGETSVPLAYTHLLPSTSVIPGGTFVVGTSLGYGFFDVFDISTNLFLDLAQVFNVSSKVHLFQNEDFAMAAFISYASQTAKTYLTNGQVVTNTYTAIQPGGVVSYYLFPSVTGHTGATFTSRNPALAKSDLQQRDGFIQGTFINQEFTYGLSRKLALSVGGSYDLTYDIWGAGASVHVGGMQFGAHYFFNVAVDSFLPVLGFGYAID
jgi:hypothetical protein